MTPLPFGDVAVPGTDVRIARLGFGAARLFSGIERRQSARLIEAALECGITHFDTAPSYSYGESESVLGDVLAGVTGVTITSKVGVAVGTSRKGALGVAYRLAVRPLLARVPALKTHLLAAARKPPTLAPVSVNDVNEGRRRILARETILRSVEGSLRRLRRERLDILLVHEPRQFALDAATQQVFDELRTDGVIGAYGLGYGGTPEQGTRFGSIVQSRWPSLSDHARALQIWHGVIRTECNASSHERTTPAQRVGDILTKAPDVAVVVSASAAAQIRDIVRFG